MKIAYGILNWNNDCEETLESLKTVPVTDIYVCTNMKDIYKPYGVTVMEADMNVSRCRNMLLDRAVSDKYEYMFMLEDDIVVVDMSIFDRYVQIMKWLDQGFIMYGYNGVENRVYNKPNPAVIIRLDEVNELYFNRTPTTSCLGFDLVRNILRFDTDYVMTELGDYLQRCSDAGVFKTGNGFYADAVKSYECFRRVDVKHKRMKSQELLNYDRKIMGEKKVEFKMELNLDKLIAYLKTLNFS